MIELIACLLLPTLFNLPLVWGQAWFHFEFFYPFGEGSEVVQLYKVRFNFNCHFTSVK